jgi:chaperone BCS1
VKDIIQKLIEISFNATREIQEQGKSQVSVYKREEGQWNSYILSKRTFDSIYLPNRLMKHIRNEFDGFIEIEKLYREYQIPYKKGILFYGPPGTGKTSLVKALAFEYQLPLYIIDVNDESINDDSIVTILNGLGNTGLKLLLFEDIDTAFADKEKVKNESKIQIQQQLQQQQQHQHQKASQKSSDDSQKGESQQFTPAFQVQKKFLTYSGLLNALDGVMSNQSGVVTVMTTNYLERLGPAFLRPGRIDVKFELKECNAEQIAEMTNRFLKKRIEMGSKIFSDDVVHNASDEDIKKKIDIFAETLTDDHGQSNVKPCQLQFYLLRYIRNIDDIFDNVKELLDGNPYGDSDNNKVVEFDDSSSSGSPLKN